MYNGIGKKNKKKNEKKKMEKKKWKRRNHWFRTYYHHYYYYMRVRTFSETATAVYDVKAFKDNATGKITSCRESRKDDDDNRVHSSNE